MMHINKKWSFGYAILKRYVRFCLRIYFGKVEVSGLENIPKDAPYIFAPNHQNALLDALLILCFTKKQPLSLARADVFKITIVRKILNWMKMLPVFRPHDGLNQMGRNEAIFREAIDFLLANNPLIIFPEGNHSFRYYLRTLKKGILRIAFRTQAELQGKPRRGIQLIPTGIDYQGHYGFRQGVLIRFGKPFDIAAYYDDYLKDPVHTMNHVRDNLWKAIDREIVNITVQDEYDTIKTAMNIMVPERCRRQGIDLCHLNKKLPIRKQVSQALMHYAQMQNNSYQKLKSGINQYWTGLKKIKFSNLILQRNHSFARKWPLYLFVLVSCFPFFVLGALLNYLPLKLVINLVHKLTKKDPQFIPTLRFGLGMLMFPLNYLLWGLAFHYLAPGPSWLIWPFLIIAFLSGIIAYQYHRFSNNFAQAWRLKRALHKKNPVVEELLKKRQEIIQQIDSALTAYQNT